MKLWITLVLKYVIIMVELTERRMYGQTSKDEALRWSQLSPPATQE